MHMYSIMYISFEEQPTNTERHGRGQIQCGLKSLTQILKLYTYQESTTAPHRHEIWAPFRSFKYWGSLCLRIFLSENTLSIARTVSQRVAILFKVRRYFCLQKMLTLCTAQVTCTKIYCNHVWTTAMQSGIQNHIQRRAMLDWHLITNR